MAGTMLIVRIIIMIATLNEEPAAEAPPLAFH